MGCHQGLPTRQQEPGLYQPGEAEGVGANGGAVTHRRDNIADEVLPDILCEVLCGEVRHHGPTLGNGHLSERRSQHPQRLGFAWLGTQQPLRQSHDGAHPACAQKPGTEAGGRGGQRNITQNPCRRDDDSPLLIVHLQDKVFHRRGYCGRVHAWLAGRRVLRHMDHGPWTANSPLASTRIWPPFTPWTRRRRRTRRPAPPSSSAVRKVTGAPSPAAFATPIRRSLPPRVESANTGFRRASRPVRRQQRQSAPRQSQ